MACGHALLRVSGEGAISCLAPYFTLSVQFTPPIQPLLAHSILSARHGYRSSKPPSCCSQGLRAP